MGWTISHGPQRTHILRSYGTIDTLGQHLADTLSSSDWRTLKPLFAPRADAYFDISPTDAARMATALRKAASHWRMLPEWAHLALQLADSAQRAADNRQPWEWR